MSQWHLQCDRERGLQQLWQAHKRLREQALAMAGLASIERMVLQHEGSTCHLMHLLFSEVNHAGKLQKADSDNHFWSCDAWHLHPQSCHKRPAMS